MDEIYAYHEPTNLYFLMVVIYSINVIKSIGEKKKHADAIASRMNLPPFHGCTKSARLRTRSRAKKASTLRRRPVQLRILRVLTIGGAARDRAACRGKAR
jgi:hypothetical protein